MGILMRIGWKHNESTSGRKQETFFCIVPDNTIPSSKKRLHHGRDPQPGTVSLIRYRPGLLSFLFLGLIFLCTGTVWCLFVAISASAIADTFRDNPKIQQGFDYFTCILFIGLGIGIMLGRI